MAEQNCGQKSTHTIVVIGAGVIGLTCALSIQSSLPKNAYDVLIVAQEWPSHTEHSIDYASVWAGAHVRPIPACTPQLAREAAWLRRTVAVFRSQAEREPWMGASAVPAVEYLAAPDASYREQNAVRFATETGLGGYRQFQGPDELPAGIELGFTYESFCINAPVYCASLLRRFLLHGGRTLRRSLASEWEAFSLAGETSVVLVVNASGRGFADPRCFPTRGQIVLTNLCPAKPRTVTRQNADGTWSFVIPRSLDGGTIIGGTKEPSDWFSEPRLSTRQQLLSAALEQLGTETLGLPSSCTSIGSEVVIKDVVGRRPTRHGGMRIEVQRAPGQTVVHAYGAGGRGYEISWGVADEVAGLVKQELLMGDVQGAAAFEGSKL